MTRAGTGVQSGRGSRHGCRAPSPFPEDAMHTILALVLMIAQPAPKQKERPEPKLDPFVAKAIEPDPKDTPLRKLQKERCRERAVAIGHIKGVIEIGNWLPSYYTDYIKLQSTLWENLAEAVDTPADKVKCYELRLDAMKEIERFTKVRVEAGNDPPQHLNIAKANRIDAEIELLKLKEKAGKK